jgi:hypothetical protein
MTKVSHQEYRNRAEECARLAGQANNIEVRETLLHLGQRWADFAVDVATELNQCPRDRRAAVPAD